MCTNKQTYTHTNTHAPHTKGLHSKRSPYIHSHNTSEMPSSRPTYIEQVAHKM